MMMMSSVIAVVCAAAGVCLLAMGQGIGHVYLAAMLIVCAVVGRNQ